MHYKLDSKKHLSSMAWFAKNSNLESIPLKWEDLGEYNLPPGILEKMKEWEYISKSPYSNSFYSSKDVTFATKPNGSMRVSDHWNFVSRRDSKIHSKTDISVENNKEWCIGVFNEEKRMYTIIYSEADLSYLKQQEISRRIREYLTNIDTINRKRLFKSKMDNHEIQIEMDYNGKEIIGLLHKYTGIKISVVDSDSNVIYSNGELETNKINKLIIKDKIGNIIEDPYVLPSYLTI
jgi:hypothetical protein